ncbi:MAG: hypothetical protein KA998_04715 [Rickettsiaceae bacterium]|nr:hypothetical protein [Rickettsiaceae bacterium]
MRVISLILILITGAHFSFAQSNERGSAANVKTGYREGRGAVTDPQTKEHHEEEATTEDLLGSDYLDQDKKSQKSEYQKVIDDYKAFLATVKPEVVTEIREYRKSVVKINKEKKDLYNSLSQEAQNYLAKEQEMKRRLPVNSDH